MPAARRMRASLTNQRLHTWAARLGGTPLELIRCNLNPSAIWLAYPCLQPMPLLVEAAKKHWPHLVAGSSVNLRESDFRSLRSDGAEQGLL